MGRSPVRMLIVASTAAGLMLGTGGCHFAFKSSSAREVDKHDLENQINEKMTDGSNKPASVTCPSGLPAKVGASVKCTMVAGAASDQINVTATVTAVEGKTVRFDLLKSLEADRVAKIISDKLYEINGVKPDSVTCPEDLKGNEGAQIRCQYIQGRKTYAVTATTTTSPGPSLKFNIKRADN